MLGVISGINVFVKNYDEAITFYCDVLGFSLVENTEMTPDFRWVTVKPSEESQTQIILAKAQSESELALVGKQAGNGVLMIITTQDFDASYQKMKQLGVRFIEEPRDEPYGKVVIFEDLYGNKFDLIEPL